MNLYYWSPFLSEVATVKAVLNSAHSLSKYSKGNLKPCIINSVGEWNSFKDEIKDKQIELIDFYQKKNFYKNLPRFGYIKSRYSYLLIILKSYRKLYKFLKSKGKNDYIIIHLISSLPLIYLILFKFECKFILRISGFPKLNIFRKILWKYSGKRLHKIFSPTIDTKTMLVNLKIFSEEKIELLRDPIINIRTINSLKKEKIWEKQKIKNYIINAGRLTKQKNQSFLIEGFALIKKKNKDLKLLILGDGELKNKLINQSIKLNIEKDLIFLGHKENVYPYYKNAMCFVLTSRWEDPGFVMIEAAASKLPIISSDCNNGPKEFIKGNKRGYLYKNFSLKSFEESFEKFMYDRKIDNKIVKNKILEAFKESGRYTKFSHYKKIINILIN